MAGKRGNGEGSIFRYGQKWRATISVVGSDGKRSRRTKTCATRADAVAQLRAMQAAKACPVPEENPTTVSEWLYRWLENGRMHWADNTYQQHLYIVKSWVVGYVGAIRLTDLTAEQVRDMLAAAREERGAKSRVLQLMRAALVSAYNVAVEDGVVVSNPVVRVKRPKDDREELLPFTEDEVRLILTETTGNRYHAAYVLALTLGLRVGEILGLRPEHFDLAAGTLRIEEQLIEVHGRLERKKPKTKRSRRTLSLTDTAKQALIAHRAILLREGNHGGEWLFPAREGGPTRRTNFVGRHWNPLLVRLKLKHRGIHHARHTFATLALRRGVPVTVVSAVLGHSSPDITYRVYSHFQPGDQVMAVAAMDAIISGGSSVAIGLNQKSS